MDFPISVPSVGLVGGKFVDEDPLAGTPGSLIPAQWGNAVTEEVLNAIVAAGITPDEDNNAQLVMAIRLLQKQPVLVTDTGVVNAYAAVNSPALSTLPAKGYVQRIVIAHANTGPATYAPDGLAAKPIYGLGLQPLQGGELPVGIAVLMYLVQAGVNGGNGAWIIIESLGGASQVAPATQSAHALQLGQAVGRLLSVQAFDVAGTFTYTPSSGTKSIVVEVQAAGGGGGAAAANGANLVSAGQGGGGGAYGMSLITAGFAGTTITVGSGGLAGTTAGANAGTGGSSSFGGFISCAGGPGGRPGASLPPPALAQSPLAGAVAPSGANIKAVPGSQPVSGLFMTNTPVSGKGGDSFFGTGGLAIYGANVGNGGTGFGSGGSGGASGSSVGVMAGGPGAVGKVVVWEYS